MGSTVALFVYAAYLNGIFGQITKDLPSEYISVVCFLIPIHTVGYVGIHVGKGLGKFKALNVIQLAIMIGYAASLVLFTVGLQMGLKGAVIAMITETVGQCALVIVFLLQAKAIRPVVSMKFLPSTLKYGFLTIGGTISSQANDRLDQFLLGYFVTAEMLGLYSVAYSLSKLLTVLPTALAPVFMNRVVQVIKDDMQSLAKAIDLLFRVHKFLLAGTVVVALTMLTSAYWLIPVIYGLQYEGIEVLTLILVLGLVPFASTRRIIDKFHNAINLPLYPTYVQAAGLIPTVIFGALLIPKLGAVGAALTSSISWIIATLVSLFLLQKSTRQRVSNLFSYNMMDYTWLMDQIKAIKSR